MNSPTPPSTLPSPPHYAAIDALRGLAILGVVMVHASQKAVPTSPLMQQITAQGARGVQLFYLLSALTLFLSLQFRRSTGRRAPLSHFFIRRFFRIAPAFYAAIVGYLLLNGTSPHYWAPDGIKGWHILSTFLFINGWTPETITSVVPGGWSIAVEMTFYLCVPFLFLWLSSIPRTLIALVLSLLLAKAMSVAALGVLTPLYPDSQSYLLHGFVFLWFFSQLPVFLLGILIYHTLQRFPQIHSHLALALYPVAVFLSVAFFQATTYSDLLPQHFLFSVALAFLVLAVYHKPHALLVNPILCWIGRVSFSMYLIHIAVLTFLSHLGSKWFELKGNWQCVLITLIATALSLALASLSYQFIEQPGIKLGRQLTARLQSRPTNA